MAIGISVYILDAIGFGALVYLFAGSEMAQGTVEIDPELEEQPIGKWGLASGGSALTTRMNTR